MFSLLLLLFFISSYRFYFGFCGIAFHWQVCKPKRRRQTTLWLSWNSCWCWFFLSISFVFRLLIWLCVCVWHFYSGLIHFNYLSAKKLFKMVEMFNFTLPKQSSPPEKNFKICVCSRMGFYAWTQIYSECVCAREICMMFKDFHKFLSFNFYIWTVNVAFIVPFTLLSISFSIEMMILRMRHHSSMFSIHSIPFSSARFIRSINVSQCMLFKMFNALHTNNLCILNVSIGIITFIQFILLLLNMLFSVLLNVSK